MITQLFGPVIDLVGNGSFRAWTIGDWFLVKYSNAVMFALVAGLFLIGLVINFPEHSGGGNSGGGKSGAGDSGAGDSGGGKSGAGNLGAVPVEEHQ